MNDFSNNPTMGGSPSRRTDLDALRGVAMILGIVLHALLSFIPVPWPVQDTRQNGLFFIPYAAIHMFRMPLFFLISGFFTMFILQRHGLGGMIRQRVQRILLPLLLALLTIVPVDNLLKREARMLVAPDPGRCLQRMSGNPLGFLSSRDRDHDEARRDGFPEVIQFRLQPAGYRPLGPFRSQPDREGMGLLG